ncbi:MAG: flagellar filament capping protein FliD [Lachnospiraceae bacterium]|nr:flagellar filament capping protein FliD [Lachnospiraceae bacterium]
MAIRIAGMASGMDTDAMVQDLVKAYKTKGANNVKTQKRAELKQDKWKDLNKKIKSLTSKYVANMQYSSYYNKKTTKVSDDTKASVVTADNAVTGTQTLEVEELAKAAYLTSGKFDKSITADSKMSDLGFNGSTTITVNQGVYDEKTGKYSKDPLTFDVTADTKISDVVDYFKAAGYNASFDANNGRMFISAKNSGADNNFSFDTSDTEAAKALEALKFTTSDSKKIDGSNAKIKLNGADFESNSNTFNINGLTITAKEKTQGEISINTENDYSAIYDNIKSFIKDYNSLINEMTKLYNAPANKGYDPLTDEEQEALSESEIKKWESKVDESLLRRDSNLGEISRLFRDSMSQTFEIGGKTISLSTFGINTGNYFMTDENERYAFHIDGDTDDSTSSGNTDKLKAMIAADPDTVTSFFTKLASNMYDKLNSFTRSSETRSYGSYYDDKQMKSDITKYEKKVSDWDDYVKEIEDRYYKQFSKMESAMTKLNSQQNYISSMFGIG